MRNGRGLPRTPAALPDARRLLLWVAPLQRPGRRPLEHRAVDVEARAVAGAVPAALGAVPAHQAAEVRAAQRDRVHRAVLVAVDALLAEPVAADARLARCGVA